MEIFMDVVVSLYLEIKFICVAIVISHYSCDTIVISQKQWQFSLHDTWCQTFTFFHLYINRQPRTCTFLQLGNSTQFEQPINFFTFKASKWHLSAVQTQFTTLSLRPCVNWTVGGQNIIIVLIRNNTISNATKHFLNKI